MLEGQVFSFKKKQADTIIISIRIESARVRGSNEDERDVFSAVS